jgi:hypothetical protein
MILHPRPGAAAVAKLESLRKEFSAWEKVSRGADSPKE